MVLNFPQTRFFLFISLLISTTVFGTTPKENVDQYVKENYPKRFSTIEKFANRVKTDFKTKEEQARAIYCWMAYNISYDVKGLNEQKVFKYSYNNEAQKLAIEKQIFKEIAEDALKDKSAICDGYSKLYKAVCDELGIECEIVEGFSRVYLSDLTRKFQNPDHAWNAIKIDDKWFLVDVTWGAGYLDQSMKFVWEYEPLYFKGSPEVFFRNHYPSDKKWLFMDKTLTDFTNQPLYYLTSITKETEVLAPLTSFINQKEPIEILIKTKLEEKNFNYAFDTEPYLQNFKMKYQNDHLSLLVSPPKRKSKYLTIYYNGSGIITYKCK
ncbi:transglutaminase domain-containing protein [Flammeovirga sp. EKP202]|uniref:transglutaminase domain-containing protein n=1 Tax=Flammeovirga sp. EKP202 TaxID=2770592 RepID=UPI00165FA040|nr:transglutaminase domain-containing protein [Flammeovirga sp. EKP202]MBD0401352.1 hypothetical protein [Flammeovirga sp. EKP202]